MELSFYRWICLGALFMAGCAPAPAPNPAEKSQSELQTALLDLELRHPRLTSDERETLHQRRGFRSSLKDGPGGTLEYSIAWSASDHRVDVSGSGSLRDITRAEVRRFAPGH